MPSMKTGNMSVALCGVETTPEGRAGGRDPEIAI
jgi:hypothetical protein